MSDRWNNLIKSDIFLLSYEVSNMDYAEKLKEYRKHELLTQKELAKKLGVAFVSVNRWECGHHEPTMKIKRQIRKLLHEAGIKED